MRAYKLYIGIGQTVADGAFTINDDGSMTSFLFDPSNTDYAQYLIWLSEGNTPDPADIIPEPLAPTLQEKLANAGLTVDELKGLLGLV
jgi:hypothetical protein